MASVAIGFVVFLGFLQLIRDEPMDPVPNIFPSSSRSATSGPLRQHPKNPRYFADSNGKPVYLTGSHTWNNVQDISRIAPKFDFGEHLQFLRKWNHNFTRFWAMENSAWEVSSTNKVRNHPMPFRRTGPGMALDGDLRFDLNKMEPAYLERLRSRAVAASKNGVYVSVMLFNGWCIGKKPGWPGNPWPGHPFHRDNNINGVDGDLDGDNEGNEVHTLESQTITKLQENYVREVVDHLNDLDNILWEISNESMPGSKDWQYHMIRFIKNYEATKQVRHPVGMTVTYPAGINADLFASPADWVSPRSSDADPFQECPPVADGKKVVILDTDHLWGVGGNRSWVWKSFTRGFNPVFMDPLDGRTWETVQRAMGDTRACAEQIDLAAMTPRPELASTGFCLADPGQGYIVYLPIEGAAIESARFFRRFKPQIRNFLRNFKQSASVNLESESGRFTAEWFDPLTGDFMNGGTIDGGSQVSMVAPFRGDAVLRLKKERPKTVQIQ